MDSANLRGWIQNHERERALGFDPRCIEYLHYKAVGGRTVGSSHVGIANWGHESHIVTVVVFNACEPYLVQPASAFHVALVTLYPCLRVPSAVM